MARLFRRIRNVVLMDRSDPHAFDGKCEFCGLRDELRPYGPNNENICYDCAMKDKVTAERKFHEMLDGAD